MAEIISTKFQLKRGLANAWQRNNPILAPGEPGWTIDTHVLKIGDGVTPWNILDAVSGEEISEEDIQRAINAYLEEHPITIDNDTIKVNEENKFYVSKVSTDILEQGEMTLVFCAGTASTVI